ncbi:hypothetical protein [Clostridium septicum]|uniref:Uncharacterized protein n=1 Tax=Clostridium septicum TaxID=1504 RepID=A0A9N7PKW2_CLOSE|nr:hypothetical protein [Clostridium septicum]AYE33946.1 hypothetical protein CP523_05385 [Clostridium septicum]MDU1312900.1 hypothetical protein [Clostridium septicum]UEC21443.1 hypothetical protein LK444_03455 [Clostridium septicum]USS00510.1 hypothetical protein NH397_13630 [Clostridium septicum]WLF69059.1 hypothetical protein Q6375_13920 [Clostridium septicum]
MIKEYLKIYKSNSYGILTIRNFFCTVLIGILFYIQIRNNLITNDIILISFSILIIMFACDSINNKLFINANNLKFEKKTFYTKIISSNIVCTLNISSYVLIWLFINIYLFDYTYNLNLTIKLLTLIIFSLALGNLLLATNHNKITLNISNKTKDKLIESIIPMLKTTFLSITLAIVLYYLLYNCTFVILFPLSILIYILSLLINIKISSFN